MSLSEWKTEKAILEQRNELLQLQVQELKEREENYKKFNDTILNAYNSLQTDVNKQNSKVYKEIQLTLEQYSKELIESKNKSSGQLLQLETENRELKNQLTHLENKCTQLQKKCQQLEIEKNDERYSFVEERQSHHELKKRVEDNKENLGELSQHSGCIVSLKQNQKKRSKTQLNQQRPELSISNVLNCKNSNVMEINPDFFKVDSQQSPNSLNGLFRQYQRQRRPEESERTDSSSPKYTNSQSLAVQLKQLTKELKNTKNEIENSSDTASVNQLKHEIKFMINKLLKAKGQMTESMIGKSQEPRKSESQIQDRPTHKSLAEFTRQINAVKSIENFQMVLKQRNVNSYKNF